MSEPGSLIALRSPDLQFVRQGRRDRVRYVASDLRRGKHAALRPDAYRLLGEFDGRRSLAQIYARGDTHLPPREAAARVVLQLHAAGLIEAVEGKLPERPAAAGSGIHEAKLVSWRRELLDLSPWLPTLDRLFGWMFTRTGLIAWALLGIATFLATTSASAPEIDVGRWLAQLTVAQAAVLYVLFLVLKALHEAGHAVAYRRLAAAEGVKVASVRAGLAVMFLMPFPFTNVTGAWRLANRWRRAAIGAAGMYIESWPALAGALVWATVDDPVVRSVGGHVAAVAGLTTVLFNLNPLGRMDGYYIFADIVDQPNLGRSASQAALNLLARIAGTVDPDRLGPIDLRMLGFWAGSMFYRLLIYTGLFWTALTHGATLAVVVLLIAGSLLAVRPMAASLRWLTSVSDDKPKLRRRLIGAAVIAVLLLLVPLPSTVALSGIVENPGLTAVFPPRAARVISDHGRPAFDATALRLDLAEYDAKRALAMARWQRALTEGDPRARDYSEEANALEARVARLRDDVRTLDLGLRGAGVVPLDLADHQSSWVPTGGRPIAVDIRAGRPVIRAVGAERDRDRIVAARSGAARPLGRPDRSFNVAVADVAPETAENLPSAALGRPAGGSIPVDMADSGGRRAAEPVVAVLLRPSDGIGSLRQGQRVEVRLRGDAAAGGDADRRPARGFPRRAAGWIVECGV